MTEIVRYSNSFDKDYQRFSPMLQHLVEGAVHDLHRRMRDLPKTWRKSYDRLSGFKEKILKIDVTGGHRLLILDGDELVLWKVGNHDFLDKVTANNPEFPNRTDVLPPQFELGVSPRLFPEASPLVESLSQLETFVTENSGEWIYELAEEQWRVAQEIFSAIEDHILEGTRGVFSLNGGPGTGKTAILLWLLKSLSDLDPEGSQLRIRLEMPPQVLTQVRACTGWDLNPFLYEKEPDVVLIDDPRSLTEVDIAAIKYPGASIVAGFDPLQMAGDMTDRQLSKWMAEKNVERWGISSCYRQKEIVGRSAKAIIDRIAESSPYLDHSKKMAFAEGKKEVTHLSNFLTFENVGGNFQVINGTNFSNWLEKYFEEAADGRLWTHSPPLLVVIDPNLGASAKLTEIFSDLKPQLRATVISFSECESVKGLDFQHALVVISSKMRQELESGFEGKGRKKYESIQLLRIPFTRPKDTLTLLEYD
jgi:hypothetical protein